MSNINKNSPFIFVVIDKTSFEIKEKYYIKHPNRVDANKISKEEWFKLHDKGYQIHAPVTFE